MYIPDNCSTELIWFQSYCSVVLLKILAWKCEDCQVNGRGLRNENGGLNALMAGVSGMRMEA